MISLFKKFLKIVSFNSLGVMLYMIKIVTKLLQIITKINFIPF